MKKFLLTLLVVSVSIGFGFYSPKLTRGMMKDTYTSNLTKQGISYETEEQSDGMTVINREVEFEGYKAKQSIMFYSNGRLQSEIYLFKPEDVNWDADNFAQKVALVFKRKGDTNYNVSATYSPPGGVLEFNTGKIAVLDEPCDGYQFFVSFFK